MLSPNEEKFCKYMLTAKSEKVAYRDAYPESVKLTDRQVTQKVWALLNRPAIAERVQELRDGAAKAAQFGLREILLELVDIATADPNEIIQHRRICCRYCHGEKHRPLWDWSEYVLELETALAKNTEPPAPVSGLRGGVGYDKSLPPHPNCPECYGDGVGEVWLADTRQLRGKAAKLYSGVKVTKNGIEVLMRDQDAALRNLGLALGAFNDKAKEKPDENPAEFLRELGMILPN